MKRTAGYAQWIFTPLESKSGFCSPGTSAQSNAGRMPRQTAIPGMSRRSMGGRPFFCKAEIEAMGLSSSAAAESLQNRADDVA